MIKQHKHFKPDWALPPPGAHILDFAEEQKWPLDWLAQQLELNHKEMDLLIAGEITINADIARKLSKVIGSTESFWLALEKNYCADKRKRETNKIYNLDIFIHDIEIDHFPIYILVNKEKSIHNLLTKLDFTDDIRKLCTTIEKEKKQEKVPDYKKIELFHEDNLIKQPETLSSLWNIMSGPVNLSKKSFEVVYG